SHGGILGVLVAFWLFARSRRVPLSHLLDLACLTAPMGLFLGRIANFINGELWGRPSLVPWAVIFKDSPAMPPGLVRGEPRVRGVRRRRPRAAPSVAALRGARRGALPLPAALRVPPQAAAEERRPDGALPPRLRRRARCRRAVPRARPPDRLRVA